MTDQPAVVHRPIVGPVIYAPGHREDLVRAALDHPDATTILDLEDSVPDLERGAAQSAVATRTASADAARASRIVVRVRPVGPDGADDLEYITPSGVRAVLWPKIDSASEAGRAVRLMRDAFGPDAPRLWIMIESPAAVEGADELAATDNAIEALVLGYGDLAKRLGVDLEPDVDPLREAGIVTMLAARKAGKLVIDGVELTRGAELTEAIARSIGLGYDGKTVFSAGQAAKYNSVVETMTSSPAR